VPTLDIALLSGIGQDRPGRLRFGGAPKRAAKNRHVRFLFFSTKLQNRPMGLIRQAFRYQE
jgi:hypothetical protein